MQKKIIALAVAGLVSGGAFAQASNVTISGQMKLDYEGVSAGGCSAANCTNLTSRGRVTQNTSNVMFSGSENLGNGMTAGFLIDSEVGADVAGAGGNGGGTFGSREVYASLSGGFGTVLMGRANAHYTEMAGIDAAGFNDLPLATNSINMFGATNRGGAAATQKPGLGGRLDNVVAYLTPNFNGFTGKLAYTTQSEATTAGIPAKDSGWNLVGKYANGPIAIAYSHLKVNNTGAAVAGAATAGVVAGVLAVVPGAAATSGLDIRSDRLGLAYSFPMGLKVGLIWDKSKQETVGVANTDSDRTAWTLPISYTTGAHSFYYTYGHAGNLGGAANAAITDTGFKMNTLSYSYAMSKRTQVHASWVRLSNDTNSAQDFWTRGVGMTAAVVGADPTTFSVGMRHSF